MKPIIAAEILVKLMSWDSERLTFERPRLDAIAAYKLDEYQQFTPGVRFIESLANWLKQFSTLEERETAYKFVTEHLLFLSNSQIFRLIDVVYSMYVKPIISRKTADELNLKPFKQQSIINSDEYKRNQRTSLYIGLSDGAKIDYFRRSNRINNEQILLTYSISDEKITDMSSKLKEKHQNAYFETIFLIDDFTASGKSFIRLSKGEYKGKLIKTIELLLKNNIVNPLTNNENFELHILFYVATTDALSYIDNEIINWKNANNKSFKHTVNAIQRLSESFNDCVLENEDLLAICEKYFDTDVVDDHYKEGASVKPYLGFNEGALPLVLNHNTPNNSLPILWLPEDMKFRGLFPRVSRHTVG